MFDKTRMITKGVQVEIDQYIQNLMWYMIENMEVEKKDYLQVFEFTEEMRNNQPVQKVVHSQEIPQYKAAYIFKTSNIITKKVYVIDDEKVRPNERETISEIELRKILLQIKSPTVRAVLFTLYYAGLRIQVALKLKLEDVDLEQEVIRVKDTKNKSKRF